jgi:membrane-bound serine protease (ClpP class)
LRRLLIGLVSTVAAIAVLSLTGPLVRAQSEEPAPGPVDVLQVSGLIDPIVVSAIDDAIDRADSGGAQALVLQVNSRGAVVSRHEMVSLLERIADAPIPIAIWVGPSGARLYGTGAQILAVADVTGMASGSRVGYTGVPLSPNGVSIDFGAAEIALHSGSVGLTEARELGVFKQRVADQGIPTISSMINALDGYEEGGRVVETTTEQTLDDGTVRRDTTAVVRFSKLSLVDQLFHTAASPAVAYLLLLVGLSLLVFEFFTAGIGIAGVVGAVATVLAATGLATLPARGWAIALLLAAMLAFAVDVQVGIPRLWTGIGMVLTIVGSWWLFEPLPGATLRPSWITLLAAIGGVLLAFVVGMPSMVRTRFATPTIGREWMVGTEGEAIEAVDPEGVVSVGDARWRARTNRATPVAAGQPVRVVAIDGVTLEVEPLEGAARDYRERRGSRGG